MQRTTTYPSESGDCQFTSREIDQICALVREWSNGGEYVSPRLRAALTRTVRRWSVDWCLLVEVTERGQTRLAYPRYDRPARWTFLPARHLPVEALWRMVEPMLLRDGATGYSMSTKDGWLALNIWPRESKYDNERDRVEQEEALGRLCDHQYIYFQRAGTIWNIERDRERCA